MKKKTKKIIVYAAVVAAVGAGLLIYSTTSVSAQQSGLNTGYGTDIATKGNISLTVSGSGNLAAAKTLSIDADSHLDINELLVSEGDTVQTGQPLATLDTDEMQSYADDLKSQIESVQTQIDTTNSVTTRLSIKSPADGWVKRVVLDEDDSIESAMNKHGYVALVATEKREIINAANSGLNEGDTVKVKCQGHTYTGKVKNENGTLYVSIATVARSVGAEASVYDKNGKLLFKGKIELAKYLPVESSFGIITDVKFSENDEIEAGETIYKAEQYSQDVAELYDSLSELKTELTAVEALIDAGQITSPAAGLVDTVNITAGQTCEEGTQLLTLDSTSDLIATVSIDELDINSITVGQSVDVTLDSLPEQMFKGEVSRISGKGAASGGITTYDVDVAVDSNDSFKLGMSVSCEITAQEAKDAVLIPVDDVITTNSHSYVMAAVERTDAEKAEIKQLITNNDYAALQKYMGDDAADLNIRILPDPAQLLYGEVRAVETGIENAYFIEIKSGLNEGEKVIRQSSDSSTGSFSDRGFVINGMAMPGGQVQVFPADGMRQSGRNSGRNSDRN